MTAGIKLRVLNFHGIGTPGRPLDPGEGDYWISADRFRSVLDRIADHPQRDCLSLTFDDGNLSDLSIAAPELERRGLGARFFVLTGRIGRSGSLGRGDIGSLIDGGMCIGSHGVAHRDWAGVSHGELQEELNQSKAVLEDICGEPVRSAAIPFGRYNAGVLAALRAAGYKEAYSSDGGVMDTTAFVRPRTSIRRDTTDEKVDRILAGHLAPARLLRRTVAMSVKRWF
ncbi:glycosyl transferase [Mesorhizobium sp. L-8-10]|uniref:polysaccharide deacetylase family protein n=1 Tax=unclassified Mesorhizobium TaxID=325217 RepID=UPI0019274175|nr:MULTISPECIES: polysaccharide deacetylase family protein [unclassified Mesorhizobium]BCH27563.1 glycosyl transferase [Mesorhizobium sp. L-8-3]BCH35520.1 glycosyl transferase [Mesorhizobium sp. L-8-10]